MITRPMTTDMAMCTALRVRVRRLSSWVLCAPRMSTVYDVVSDVRADPAAEYAAEIKPNTKSINTITGTSGCCATMPKSSSVFSGMAMPLLVINITSTVPRIRKRAMTKNCVTPLTIMFF